MTRPKNPESIEKEARLQEAVAAVLAKTHNVPSAAHDFHVPSQTLYDRLAGKPPRNQAHETEQLLSHAEEKELVKWITRLTITGYPPRYETLREMAEEIRKRRVKNINEDGLQLVEYDDIGKQWVQRFLCRHPELASVRPRSIDTARIKDTSPERLQRWFDDLEKVVTEYNIKPENMYNMDESGFAIGEKEAGRCVINAQVRQKFQAKPGRQEWVSVVECVCADGSIIPPLVIFRGEKLSRQWIPASIHGNWRLTCNSKGWTSNIHGMQWLTRCFEPETRDKAAGEYRLLICDGHDSHITGEWVAHCMDNDILLMILPPHSSHLTQPLDVGVFGPLKKHLAAEIDPLIRLGVARIQKVEWLAAFVAAHEKALCTKNILGGFRGTGIHPFEPTKVLNRVASPSPSAQTQPSTPPIPTTPFNDAVFTSSPVNFNDVQRANKALNDMIASGNPISSPAKKYITFLTQNLERFQAVNTIIQHENTQLKAHVHGKKRQLSGKRQVIDGKHHITAAELVGIQEAEKVTRERKEKKGNKALQKRGSQVQNELTDESEEELELSEDEEDEAKEIFDCIEVEL
jgi:DDE superfamily endonuclease/Tc5 transposase DNA-binding domain